METAVTALIAIFVFLIKSLYQTLNFFLKKTRYDIVSAKIIQEFSTVDGVEQFKLEFFYKEQTKYTLMDKFDASVGDEFEFFYNVKTNELIPYVDIKSSRKNNLLMAFWSFCAFIACTLISMLTMALFILTNEKDESLIPLYVLIDIIMRIVIVVFLVKKFAKNKKNSNDNIKNQKEKEVVLETSSQSNIEEMWRCMGCGRYNFDYTERCVCGYKKPKEKMNKYKV